jgi:hypothetical protein
MKNGNAMLRRLLLGAAVLFVLSIPAEKTFGAGVLNADDYAHYVTYFNGMELEENPTYAIIRNAQAWDWMRANIPLFDCPNDSFEKIYYYRWWSYRKHIKYTTNSNWFKFGLTEWVYYANPNSSAFCHHISEGRWLHNQTFLDQYILYYYRGNAGGRVGNLHTYSQWAHDALYQRYLVTMDNAFLTDLLPDLVADYTAWENEQWVPSKGLFWSYDVRDSMEMGIGGDYKPKDETVDPNQNIRPTLNSYMTANARALVNIATLANQPAIAATYQAKYDTLRPLLIAALWDDTDKFFKVQYEAGGLCTAREAIGFIPFKFNLPGPEHAEAWSALADREAFWLPNGLTTAEKRDHRYRTHGTGGCEWDGPVWPYATSQTLDGLANVLAGPGPYYATKQDYFDSMVIYAQSHQYLDPLYAYHGNPYLGEYLDPNTGYWLKGPYSERSRYYNHSTFADLVVTGLAGLRPREDNIVDVNPLVPEGSWDWFCLDQVQYHGHMLTILWDKYGTHYNRGAGFRVYADDQLIAYSDNLERVTGALPSGPDTQAPTPSTMTWAVAPHAVNRNSIGMTATTATDASGVEYYFTCTAGGGHDSGWQASPTYLDFGILRNTAYTYTVKARDASANRNQTAASVPVTATISSADVINIDFQKSDTGLSLTAPGYEMDCGYLYTNRGNGLAYGWNVNHADYAYHRNINSDQRLDTIIQFHTGGKWEMAVPNGQYTVSVTVGDPCSATTNTIHIYQRKNGVDSDILAAKWENQALNANSFLTFSTTATFNYGKITITNGSAADKATRICYAVITPPVLPDVTPPNPNPMGWNSAPQAASSSSVTMTASAASDAAGVEYYFTCTAGGGHDSGWQNGVTYTDTGLSNNTAYTYTVKARDKSSNLNATVPSTPATATTPRYDCSAYPASDYDHSCQVDFADLAAMGNTWTGDTASWLAVQQFANDWLSCNRNPSSECWQ